MNSDREEPGCGLPECNGVKIKKEGCKGLWVRAVERRLLSTTEILTLGLETETSPPDPPKPWGPEGQLEEGPRGLQGHEHVTQLALGGTMTLRCSAGTTKFQLQFVSRNGKHNVRVGGEGGSSASETRAGLWIHLLGLGTLGTSQRGRQAALLEWLAAALTLPSPPWAGEWGGRGSSARQQDPPPPLHGAQPLSLAGPRGPRVPA